MRTQLSIKKFRPTLNDGRFVLPDIATEACFFLCRWDSCYHLPVGGAIPLEFSLFLLNLHESRLPMHSLSPTARYGRFLLLLAFFRHWRPGPADEFSRPL